MEEVVVCVGSVVDVADGAVASGGGSADGGRSCLTSCIERAGRLPRYEVIAKCSEKETSSQSRREGRGRCKDTHCTVKLSLWLEQ